MNYDIKIGQVWEFKPRKDVPWKEIPADCQNTPEALEHAEICLRCISMTKGSTLQDSSYTFKKIKGGYFGPSVIWPRNNLDALIENNQLRFLYSLNPQREMNRAETVEEMIAIMEKHSDLFDWPSEKKDPVAYLQRKKRIEAMINTYGPEYEKELIESLHQFVDLRLSGKIPPRIVLNDAEYGKMLSIMKKTLSGDEYAGLELAEMMSKHEDVINYMSPEEREAISIALSEKKRIDDMTTIEGRSIEPDGIEDLRIKPSVETEDTPANIFENNPSHEKEVDDLKKAINDATLATHQFNNEKKECLPNITNMAEKEKKDKEERDAYNIEQIKQAISSLEKLTRERNEADRYRKYVQDIDKFQIKTDPYFQPGKYVQDLHKFQVTSKPYLQPGNFYVHDEITTGDKLIYKENIETTRGTGAGGYINFTFNGKSWNNL